MKLKLKRPSASMAASLVALAIVLVAVSDASAAPRLTAVYKSPSGSGYNTQLGIKWHASASPALGLAAGVDGLHANRGPLRRK